MRWFLRVATLSLLIVIVSTSSALAVLDLTLVLDDPVQTVGPGDNVDLFATLTNELSSDETLFGSDFDGASIINGTLIDLTPGSGNPYTIAFGGIGGTLVGQLSADLSPGESLALLFATLIPDPPPVAPGTYTSPGIELDYTVNGQAISVNSATGIEVTVIPEPASLALACVGVAAIMVRRWGC